MKTCTRCQFSKTLEEFPIAKGCKDGRRGVCKECFNETKRGNPVTQEKDRARYQRDPDRRKTSERERAINHPRNALLIAAKGRSKKKGVPFNLTVNDFEIPELCPYLEIPLFRGEGVHCPNSPTLDRIIPELGYVPGNVRVISHLANTMKSSASENLLRVFIKTLPNYTSFKLSLGPYLY